AERFVEQHQHQLRYVADWSQWLHYRDGCWRKESTLLAFDLARAICFEVARTRNKLSEQKKLCEAKTIAAVERIARANRALAATVDQWDRDPWLLNAPAGVVDLRNGAVRSARAEDYMTKITATAPGGDCPQWHPFLQKVTN